MTQQSIIILGAGEDQLPAYLTARRLGYRVIGVDRNPGALAAYAADEFLCLTSRDPAAIAERLGAIDVAAVLSPASDAAQASVAALSAHYGTAFRPAPLAVRASEDKAFFHEVVTKLGFPTYRHGRGPSGLRLPVVVKPTDSSGSKGLTCVRSAGDLDAALALARRHSFTGEVIVEERVEGRHYSAECFAQNGSPVFVAVTERVMTPEPEMITVSHVLPAELGEDVRDRLDEMLAALFAELGHRSGPINVDFVLDAEQRIHFIEMGARLGGNGMPMLVRHAFGLDTVEAAIRLALGESLDLSTGRQQRYAMLHILTAATDGTLTAIDGVEETRELPVLAELRLFKNVGDPVRRYTQAAHKLGYLVLTADHREDIRRGLDTALATLHFRIAAKAPRQHSENLEMAV
ncbi:ATP-grasp domain-containing protein [Actinoplanes friuliensis]|uniref:Biotin carboxylase n=1 Tax=Actinoplanes friuliensis DSM 7358 TaxID=1246995 RepID=U5WDI4_9ACTN|nr:ATP-grasp domain-containing protein [Actinoplanes friuliensis]AGZ46045.1 biotin carboxylase [Actinoplanes friuliensis DSM 7358]